VGRVLFWLSPAFIFVGLMIDRGGPDPGAYVLVQMALAAIFGAVFIYVLGFLGWIGMRVAGRRARFAELAHGTLLLSFSATWWGLAAIASYLLHH
jgi:hypothetical protein